MKPRVLLVDGNNVVHAWEDLRPRHRPGPGSPAQAELIRRLDFYRDASGCHVVVVFDGSGSSSSNTQEPGSIQVIRTASGQTADAVIEQLCRSYADRFELTVATDDLAVRDAAAAAGALPLSCRDLKRELDRSDDHFRTRWGL